MEIPKSFEKLKKLKGRSWSELRTRGVQVLSVYSEKIGLGSKIPSDSDLDQLLDKTKFKSKTPSSDDVFNQYFENAKTSFFHSFYSKRETLDDYRVRFGSENIDAGSEKYPAVEAAEKILEGKFDLLGYENLNFGTEIDWHFEPISGKRSPVKHWKLFDELDSEETGDKKIIWELNRHQHFFTLGVAYWLTNDERYASTFVRHIESWMNQNPPGMGVNWLSSLEIGFRSISWIWALNFFKDSTSFSPELFQRIIKFLFMNGRHLEKYLSTYYSPNTHLTGEALALYFLGTQLTGLQRSSHWRKIGSDILIAELDRQILSDGVYFEQSTYYQRYTIEFYTQFLILSEINKEKIDSISEDKLKSKLRLMLDFMMFVTRPDGTTPMIGDDDGGVSLPLSNNKANDFRAILSTGAALFGRSDYKFVSNQFSEETLWLLGAESSNQYEKLAAQPPKERSKAFTTGGYFVMRDGWTDTDNFLLIDCGVLGSKNCGHSHSDALAIDVAVGGKTLLVDPGTYTYHESIEWRDLFRSTMGHNSLSIDNRSASEPGGKFNWETIAEAFPKTWITEERFDYFEGSQNGYHNLDEGSAIQNRSVLFLKNDYWIIRDYVETYGTHDYQMNFHFDVDTKPEIVSPENGVSCVNETPQKGAGLRLFTFGDNGQWQKEESWVSPAYGMKVNAPFLRFISKGVGSQEFFTFLLPNDSIYEKPEVHEIDLVGGRSFVIKYRGYEDIFIFADSDGSLVRTELFETDFHFFWARKCEGETLPDEFVLINGTTFRMNKREIINFPQRLKYATARRFGNNLNVRTNESVYSVEAL
jgi:hypothetical protein